MIRLSVIALLSLLGSVRSIDAVEIGFGVVDITPPVGVPMAGYYRTRYSASVHDPLYAKAVVFRAANRTAAIVSLDLISTTKSLVNESRRLAGRRGLAPESVMVSATHAHTGPALTTNGRDALVTPAAATKLQSYLDGLPEKIVSAIDDAIADLQPSVLHTANGHCPGLAHNRRFFMADGSVGWNPGKQNPGTLRPVGPTDDSVPLLYVTGDEGQPIGMLCNFAMHLDTVGGAQISADYPYVLSELMGRWRGEAFTTLFTIGCAGDINHLNVRWNDRQKGIAEATRIGTVLAGSVMQALLDPMPVKVESIRCQRTDVPLRTPAVSDADVASARRVLDELSRAERVPFLQQVEAFKVLDVAAAGDAVEGEVQVIRLGPDVAIVGLPGEVFVELGLAIKSASPVRHTIINELAGGSIGYIPTRRAYREGNYEVISARVGEGGGEQLVEEALRLLSRPTP